MGQVGGIAMTFHYWSSAKNTSYGTYTGHFIDSNWLLRTVGMETSEFLERHTAVNVCRAVRDVLGHYKAELDKLSGVVTDEGANMVAATRLLKSQEIVLHVFAVICACHRLQIAIRHCMSLSSASSLLSQCRRLVPHFHHSNITTEALRQWQMQEGFKEKLRVIPDNARLWNSVFYMLQRLVKLRMPITIVLRDPKVSKLSD